MSKGILNKRDKMLWDNTHKPDGVNDTLDLVSNHIEDIVEDHREEIAKSVSYVEREYKEIVNITFSEPVSAINIDFDKHYQKLIVLYSHPAIEGAESENKFMYVKTLEGTQNLISMLYDGPVARNIYHEIISYAHSIKSMIYYKNSEDTTTWSSLQALRLQNFDFSKEYEFKGLIANINVPVNAKLIVYGIEA